MEKRRLKKKIKRLFLVLVLLVIGILVFSMSSNNKKVKVIEKTKEKIDYVEVVNKKINDEDISKEFLTWVNKNYKDSLSKLNKLLDKEDYDKKMWHTVTGNSYIVLNDLYNDKYKNMDNIKILDKVDDATLSFVGDVSLADDWRIMPKYDERGGINGVLSDSTLKIMKESTLMVVNSEFTVSNRGTKMAGKLYTFRAKPERLSIYDEMGVDLVTLANNHVYDYGKDAFLDMLDAFDEYKIPRIGAGRNLEEAEKPYYFIINGYKFAFVNGSRAEKYRLTPGATDESEGIFLCYDPTNMINLIKELKDDNDYVITIMHFGREDSHELEKEQVESAKAYIDAGASMVIGHHAHTLQGVEIYNDRPIIYNLGNFLFNQAEVETAIFQVKLSDDGSMEYYMIPALQKDCKTDILDGSRKEKVIKDLNSWSINSYIEENGKIIKK